MEKVYLFRQQTVLHTPARRQGSIVRPPGNFNNIMLEQVKALIKDEKTFEALTLLANAGVEGAVVLQARYNQAQKQVKFGMMDAGDWDRVVRQTNYAALEMASAAPQNPSAEKVLAAFLEHSLEYLSKNIGRREYLDFFSHPSAQAAQDFFAPLSARG
jgi:hypothetical protein